MSIHVNRDTKEVFTGDYEGTIKKWSLEDLRQAYFSTLKMVVLPSFSNLFCSTSIVGGALIFLALERFHVGHHHRL